MHFKFVFLISIHMVFPAYFICCFNYLLQKSDELKSIQQQKRNWEERWNQVRQLSQEPGQETQFARPLEASGPPRRPAKPTNPTIYDRRRPNGNCTVIYEIHFVLSIRRRMMEFDIEILMYFFSHGEIQLAMHSLYI